MKNQKRSFRVLRRIIPVISAVMVLGLSYGLYLYFMPHRNVQATETDYMLSASKIVNEYLSDSKAANDKYLDTEGESKVIEIEGEVSDISEDYNGNVVVLLKGEQSPAGVSCTFYDESNANAHELKVGAIVRVKGVIRSGAAYDEDLEMYEHVILEKCAILLDK
jgi:hypothetical protein